MSLALSHPSERHLVLGHRREEGVALGARRQRESQKVVSMGPGTMVFTQMLSGASSKARLSDRPITPALAAW